MNLKLARFWCQNSLPSKATMTFPLRYDNTLLVRSSLNFDLHHRTSMCNINIDNMSRHNTWKTNYINWNRKYRLCHLLHSVVRHRENVGLHCTLPLVSQNCVDDAPHSQISNFRGKSRIPECVKYHFWLYGVENRIQFLFNTSSLTNHHITQKCLYQRILKTALPCFLKTVWGVFHRCFNAL